MTTIVDKIRRRIRTWEMAKKGTIEEVYISREEAEQLGNIKSIDNVKLIISDKPKAEVKTDCFAYISRNGKGRCYCLNKLYCEKEKCNFYKTNESILNIERSIRKYEKSKGGN